MKSFLTAFAAMAAVVIFLVSFAVLTSDDFDFKLDKEVFPTALPPGCCLLTDGEVFEVRQVRRHPDGQKYRGFLSGECESEERAIYWAWRMIERNKKPKDATPKKERVMRPVNPELCPPIE